MINQEDEDLFFQNNLPSKIKIPEEQEEKDKEKENNLDININNPNKEVSVEEDEELEEDEEENNKELKTFTIELLIHSKVMDNRDEIKTCICHNYIFQNETNVQSLLKENENIFVEKEIIPSIEIPIIRLKKNIKEKNELNNIESPDKFYIKMNDLTKELKKKGFPMSGSMINVYINYTKNYVYFGTEPLDSKIILYSYMLEPNKDVIKLKVINYIQKRMLDGYTNAIINTYFRKPIKKNKNKKKNDKDDNNKPSLDLKIFMPSMTNIEYFDEKEKKQKDENSISLIEMEDKEEESEEEEDKIDYRNLTDANKRERKIGYIIEKVYAWRKLYNGYRDDDNKFIKYSLDEAAEKINVSKKSLDDYLLQIRLGRKCGFNFDDNKNEKIGTLRAFVEKNKKDNNIVINKKERKKKTKKEKEKEQKSKNDINIELDKSANNKSSLSLKKNKSKSKSKSFKKNK